jgi:predicted porin
MILALTAGACTAAHADGSVVLYGIIGNGIAWQSSGAGTGAVSGGHSAVKMTSGVWAGSRFGHRGTEDLGGGTKAMFTLESGVNTANGASQYANGIFTRQAWVGLI